MTPDFIPVNEPLLNGNEKKYLEQCIDTGWISAEGPFVRKFEAQFAARVERQHAMAVTNGSAALDLAVEVLDVGPGDEIIIPTFTIISCAAAVVRAGAIPVVVDCDPRTWNMDVAQIEKKITPKTRAIMVVHIYGLPVDMDPILGLSQKHGLRVIEDAAEAHGLTYKGNPCGSFGDISTFSFYPNKLVTTGEGGMVLTNDGELAARCKSLRNLCFGTDKRFVHESLGWNMRMSNLQAAVGVAQLERLDEFLVIKRRIGNQYTELMADIECIQLPHVSTAYAKNCFWVYGVVLKDNAPFDAPEVMHRLGGVNIGTRPFFWPIHEQPVFLKMGLFKNEKCQIAERIARRGFYIPSGLGLTEVQINRVADEIHKVLS